MTSERIEHTAERAGRSREHLSAFRVERTVFETRTNNRAPQSVVASYIPRQPLRAEFSDDAPDPERDDRNWVLGVFKAVLLLFAAVAATAFATRFLPPISEFVGPAFPIFATVAILGCVVIASAFSHFKEKVTTPRRD